jgi:hypothetical protein
LKYRNEVGPTCQSQQPIKTLAPGYRSPVCVRVTAADHAPEARAPSATRSTPALTAPTCPCRPYPLLPMGCHRGQPLFCLLAPRSPASALLRTAVAAENCLHVDRHLRPWNRLADATASTACAPNFSPSHEPGATTTGRCSPRRSPLAARPPPWSTFYSELFPVPTAKSGSSPRRPPPRPVSPPSAPPVHQNRPEPPPPCAVAVPPLSFQWAASPFSVGPARTGTSAQ